MKAGRAILFAQVDSRAFWAYPQKRIDEHDPWNEKDQIHFL